MKTPISLSIDDVLFGQLFTHLFPDDGDEHGAIIAAGISETTRGTRLLAREVFLARDGIDYVESKRGYRALNTDFIAEVSQYCAGEGLCYLAVHCHGGRDSVGFSLVDMSSHERGYPALLDILQGAPVGALVFAKNAVAGDIWSAEGRESLSHLTVVGTSVRRLFPSPQANPRTSDMIYDRHARLFGDLGQEILSNLKVGIIGLGGGGSLINEWLARLGVGHIVAIDFDRIDISNLPRTVGATRRDALALLTASGIPWLQRLGKRFARHKVQVARRVARQANPKIRFDAVVGDVLDEATARLLTDVDFLFLATDSIQSRLVFNALVYQYLIPGVQIGAKVPVDSHERTIGQIFVATRPVLPAAGYGCLDCSGLIPASRLREESLTEAERRAQRYVDDDDVNEPSVITLNVLSAAQAANDVMMMFTGLYEESVELHHQLNFVRDRQLSIVERNVNQSCPDCSNHVLSRRARGDTWRLPCRSN